MGLRVRARRIELSIGDCSGVVLEQVARCEVISECMKLRSIDRQDF